jgi:hypothetical protein
VGRRQWRERKEEEEEEGRACVLPGWWGRGCRWVFGGDAADVLLLLMTMMGRRGLPVCVCLWKRVG